MPNSIILILLISITALGANRGGWMHRLVEVEAANQSNPGSSIIEDTLFPTKWKVLGPFQSGTRELGYDPLSSYGGWEYIADSDDLDLDLAKSDDDDDDEGDDGHSKGDTIPRLSNIPSELVDDGYVIWDTTETRSDGRVGWDPNASNLKQKIRWEFMRNTWGWASLQHSVYYKSTFTIAESGTFQVSLDGVSSFKINSATWPGNTYSYKHASCSSIFLHQGTHSIYVATQFDIRRDGSAIPPIAYFSGTIKRIDTEKNFGMTYHALDTILPDILDNKLITQYASITLKNNMARSLTTSSSFQAKTNDKHSKKNHKKHDYSPNNGPGWKQLVRLLCYDEKGEKVDVSLTVSFTILFSPTQVHAIPFKFDDSVLDNPPKSVRFEVILTDLDTMDVFTVAVDPIELKRLEWKDAAQGYKVTTDGYDNTIQYAYVKPPRTDCLGYTKKKCPVLVALHGAGVDCGDPAWLSSIPQQDYAWVLFPSGRTSWGFDWHGPSFKNIEASLEALVGGPGVSRDRKDKMGVVTDRVVVAGHSNGGQGAWWMCSHYPDRVLGCLPASGYVKIQMYVPYYLHGGYSYADSSLRGLMEGSISEHDLDLYASNLAGMPILARTGSDDDNVPPMHTRKMVRLVKEWNAKYPSIEFVEDKGKGHWYDGVLGDIIAQNFYSKLLSPQENAGLDLPALPNPFTISTMNPASTGPRGGISILQPIIPYRISTIHVHREGNHWILTTRNVRRFGFVRDKRQRGIQSWTIDHTAFNTPPEDSGPSYLNKGNGAWELSSDLLWISRERNPTTYGPAFQIFSHPFKIVIPSSPKANLTMYRLMAEHIATSWYMYSRGSAQIIKDVEVLDGVTARYNLIVLGDPRDNTYTLSRTKAGSSKLVQFRPDGGIQIRDSVYNRPGTGSLFLAPSSARTRLGLFITGVDMEGLQRALWTIPFRTGMMVPDYTIIGEEYGDPATGWMSRSDESGEPKTKGVGGILAAGFFSQEWEFLGDAGSLN